MLRDDIDYVKLLSPRTPNAAVGCCRLWQPRALRAILAPSLSCAVRPTTLLTHIGFARARGSLSPASHRLRCVALRREGGQPWSLGHRSVRVPPLQAPRRAGRPPVSPHSSCRFDHACGSSAGSRAVLRVVVHSCCSFEPHDNIGSTPAPKRHLCGGGAGGHPFPSSRCHLRH